MKAALDGGINFFDTAEAYGSGIGERQLGNALKDLKVERSSVIITTKLFWFKRSDQSQLNNLGLSRKHVMEHMKASLARLQLESVDIVYCHRFDHETPLEEVCRGFDQLIRDGKAYYWGTSQWNVWEIVDALGICERLNLHKPVVEQPQYNMLVRDKFEVELPYVFDRYGLGTSIWSPMAGGFLSGKYLTGDSLDEDNWPSDSRMITCKNDVDSFYRRLYFSNKEVRV